MFVHTQFDKDGNCSYELDNDELKDIFGYNPLITTTFYIAITRFEEGKKIPATENFFKIENTYTICPTYFSIEIDSFKMEANGFFEGPWDEIGIKLANFFFMNHKVGSIIYVNHEKTKIARKNTSLMFTLLNTD